MMDFLYFPDDKTEYIPGLIALIICIILAYVAFVLIKKYSRKQEERAKQFEREVMKKMENQNHHRDHQ